MASSTRSGNRPRVRDVAEGRYHLEYGDMASLGSPNRLAILAHYSTEAHVSRSFRTLVRELADHEYRVVVVSAATTSEQLDWNEELPNAAIVIRQPNLGHDFGSWTIGLDAVGPQALAAESVILANDSLVGPFTSIKSLVDRFERAKADVWAMTDTYQYFHHLQSYFLGFRGGVLAEKPLVRFWSDIRIEPSKWEVIRNNELGLSRMLYREGYQTTSAFRADQLVKLGENPVIKGWWRLMKDGFPFIKREIVRDPAVAPMSDQITTYIADLYGETLDEWL